ncbi:hypothetical protein COLO4_38502 [Corchorus olitorius]|uniref:Uncharacterized protein n=1 Tax=Corchorus olitorius TaxID=93759 RepID=A0A1R3FUX2_9ROSI|nr:hypothetical protein COLO4_38502 [Corchorus olitorius]
MTAAAPITGKHRRHSPQSPFSNLYPTSFIRPSTNQQPNPKNPDFGEISIGFKPPFFKLYQRKPLTEPGIP